MVQPGNRPRTMTEAERLNRRAAAIAALDDPIIRAVISRKATESWKDPGVRVRRRASLVRAWARRRQVSQ